MYICIERYIFTYIYFDTFAKCDLIMYINRHISVDRLLDKRDSERERKHARTRVRAQTGGRRREEFCLCVLWF